MEPKLTDKKPNCNECRFYYVTWDPTSPHGCRAYGFKSKESPLLIVTKNSGLECQLFKPNPKKMKAE